MAAWAKREDFFTITQARHSVPSLWSGFDFLGSWRIRVYLDVLLLLVRSRRFIRATEGSHGCNRSRHELVRQSGLLPTQSR